MARRSRTGTASTSRTDTAGTRTSARRGLCKAPARPRFPRPPEGEGGVGTDVRFRYSTDAAYLDMGWFVDDVKLGGADAALSSSDWFLTDGKQNNNWVLQ